MQSHLHASTLKNTLSFTTVLSSTERYWLYSSIRDKAHSTNVASSPH